ncbi:MAG: hypothetical protein JXR97_05870, partial [Planctomycetes bacterium]|nr:hypothetical protein [Planctomycetota bacterium]
MIRKVLMALIFTACAVAASGSALAAMAQVNRIPPDAPVVPWTRFSIQYTVRDIGNVGPKKVEFYWTKDMGKTWSLYGEDPDAKSPMTVTVPGDGVYGFMTVGTDHVGNRERAPVSGTRPETVIIVDRTPPVGKWISPVKTSLISPSGVDLEWEC